MTCYIYLLIGIPLGLALSIPLILQNRKVTYAQQAIFSFTSWPFSVKLLWAPIVDSIFNVRFGRRKSWLVPAQYLIGLCMLCLSFKIDSLIGDDSEPVNIYALTFIFACLNTLAATQDIAVDGWALTMLKKRNVGYASTCNTVGQTVGYFLGNVVFLALESGSFCNRFLWFLYTNPSEKGLVTLSSYLFFWGIIFFIVTTLVALLKTESKETKEEDVGLVEAYTTLCKIFKLPAVRLCTVLLLTCKMGFAVADSVAGLKLIEYGVKKEHMAMMAVPMIPLQVILPWMLSKWTNGPRPLDVFIKAYPIRLLFGFVSVFLVYWTSIAKEADGSFPFYYYGVLLLVYFAHQLTVYPIYVALMAFYAKVSDPTIGGTYMTLLNTLNNLGGNWPSTLALSTVEYFNINSCTSPSSCNVLVDGFYIQSLISVVIGFFWFGWAKDRLLRLQRLPQSAWAVKGHL